MASGAEIAGTAGSVAGMIPALIGRGKNERVATSFGDSKQYDPNAGLWAGRAGAADDYSQRYQGLAAGWQGKAGEYGAQQQDLYNQGQSSMQQQQQARGMQLDAASMARARATGQVPSIAQMQGDRAMGQAVAAQASQAASARGPGGLALAQQGAANNMANAQQNIAGQSSVAAAQERLAAEQAYAQQAGAVRGGDQSAAQVSYGAGAQSGQLGLGAGQLGAQYGQMENDVRKAEMQAKAQQQQTLASTYQAAENANQQTAGANADKKGLVETIGDFFSDARAKLYPGGMTSDARAKMYSDMGTKQFGMVNGPMAGAAAAQGDITHYAMKDGGLDVMGTFEKQNAELDAARRDPTAGMTNGGALGGLAGLLPGRADGGPVQAGQPYMVGERGPEVIVPGQDGNVIPNEQLAPSTWGGGSAPDAQAQTEAALQANANANTARFAYQQAEAEVNPYQRDLNEIQAQRSSSRLLGQDPRLTEDDRRKERVAKAFLRTKPDANAADKSDPEEKAKVVAGEAVPEMTWGKALGEMGKNLNEAQFGSGGPKNPYSDMNTKKYGADGAGAWSVMPMENPEGGRLAYDDRGRGTVETQIEAKSVVPQKFARMQQDAEEGASGGLAPGGKAPAKAKGKEGGSRKMTPDELSKWADEEMAKVKAQSAAMTEQGPAVKGALARSLEPSDSPVAEGARALQGAPYVYKDAFRPPEQEPGEVNVGPTAQVMAQSPVTATAVKRDPETGMLSLDRDKLTKVNSAAIADLQKQQDELRLALGGRR